MPTIANRPAGNLPNAPLSVPDPQAQRRRTIILSTCCLSLLMVSMDVTIVNVALPSIRSDLSATMSGLQWVIDAYTLVVATFLMFGGSLGDRFGRRRIFQTGMALFTLSSLLCSLAPTVNWLVGARILQALGGCMLNPVALSIIAHVFTDPKERTKAIGIWGAVMGVSMALGPLAGGALTQSIGWRSIFWVNIPIGITAIVLAACFIPESKVARSRRADPVGQVLVLTALASLTYGIIEGPQEGWYSSTILGLFAITILAVLGLIIYEGRRHEPLIDLRFFRSVPFASATVLAICMFAGFGSFLFLNSLYLQEARGFSAFQTGLLTLPMALGIITCAPLSGRLINRAGARLPVLICGVVTVISALLLTRLTIDTPVWILLLAYLLFGIGFGMINTPITNSAVSGMPRAQAGLAAGIASTSRQIGAAVGVAVAGAVAGAQGVGGANFSMATHPVWWMVVCIGVVIITLAYLSTNAWARGTAEKVSHLLQEPGA
jgi:EmrB/QacA subfamily drug resistance transporter